jgi:spermidine synthase
VLTGYYHERSGVGLALSQIQPQAHRRIGVVGLGAGTLAAYGRDGDEFCFYEINPAVKEAAKRYFTFLQESPAKVEVVMGDARLSLEKEPARQFDLLALDAFSSDAIPVHLLTAEAFAIYLRHLKAGGVVAVHISNQHLNLRPVVRNLAAHFGLQAALISFKSAQRPWWWYPADWVLLTKNRELLESAPIHQATTVLEEGEPRGRLWTDDYASLLTLLK